MAQSTVPMDEKLMEVGQSAPQVLRSPEPEETSPSLAAHSPEAEGLRAEIIAVGRKLWERQYVDGNGGNISVRLGANSVLCTPTMMSKRDLEPADICLSDLDGSILAGDRPRTSEILLHLQIYKANPRARAVVHCHPPYATAFAVTGTTPPVGFISEYEIFIGPAAVAPYETPGTQAFAESVLPFVQDHNTILLTNHGVVCWADTAMHAEWLVEILEAYCKTYLIAKQIGEPLHRIPDEKIEEILRLKGRLGFPDARSVRLPENAEASATSDELNRIVEQVGARLQSRS